MTKTLSASALSLCALALLVAAGAGFATLSWLSKPPEFGDRVALLSDKVGEIKRLSRSSQLARDYVPGALCPSASEAEIARFAQDLQGRAAQLNLTPVALSIAPVEAVGETAAKVAFQSEFVGSYDGVMALLNDMGRQTPRLFVDRADLLDKGATVSLRFSGHFYCSTAA
jgi:hypothetical protein